MLSTAGATILGVGYVMPLLYLIWSWHYGKPRPPNPWRATGLEWQDPVAAPETQLRNHARRHPQGRTTTKRMKEELDLV